MKPKQEQIEELVYIVKEAIRRNGTYWVHFDYIEMDNNDVDHAAEESAKELYSAGYRKASDVIDEFVERLKAKESPKLLAWEYGEGYLDCIKTAEQLADEMKKEVRK